MTLIANFPDDLRTDILLESKLVPCICRISGEFEAEFLPPLFNESVFGFIQNWDVEKLHSRVVPCVGGNCYSINHAQITLSSFKKGIFQIEELIFFTPGEEFGWHPVILNGDYGPEMHSAEGDI